MNFALENIELDVYIGVTEEEKNKTQKILISVFWDTNTIKAEISDELKDTVDYFEVYQFIKNFPQKNKFNLLEKIHKILFQEIKKNFPLENLKLEIKKIPFPDATITIKK